MSTTQLTRTFDMEVSDLNDPLPDVKNHLTDFRLTLDAGSPLRLAAAAGRWWSALLTLEQDGDGISIDAFIATLPTSITKNMLVPVAYDLADRAQKHNRNFVSVIIRKTALDALNDSSAYPAVTNIALGTYIDPSHIDFDAAPQHPAAAKTKVSPDTVIMAVIDDGIAIAHDLFRDGPTSTRVLHADLQAVAPLPATGNATYGRVLDKPQIDMLLNTFQIDGVLDEAAFYNATGQIDFGTPAFDPISQRRSHGTHVTALAAGYPIEMDVQNRPIICAALPAAVTFDITGQSLLPSLALALQSISSAAQQYQLKGCSDLAPIMLNFSYGNTSGPHDGTDETSALLEWYSTLVPNQKIWMTLPAGNNNLSQGHAVMPLAQKNTLTMVVLPDDRTASHVEMWMPFGISQADIECTEFTVRMPTGECIAFTPKGLSNGNDLYDRLGRIVGRISYNFQPKPTERGMVLISLNPTYSLEAGAQLAPSGRWLITAKNTNSSVAGELSVWIRRDESQPGYNPGGRQSYFVDPLYKRFGAYGQPSVVDPTPDLSLIRHAGTLSGFACGQSPIVVASLTQSTCDASAYSASGEPTITPNSPSDPVRKGPDVTALGDDSLVLGGVISAGTSSGSFLRMNGTSVASPRLARFAADYIGNTDLSARAFISQQPIPHRPYDLRTGAGPIEIPVPWRTEN